MVDFQAALNTYTLSQPISVQPMTQGGRNNQLWMVQAGKHRYVLKQHISSSYDENASIEYEYHVLRQLAQQGLSFALPVPVLTRANASFVQTETGCFSLAPQFPGKRPDDQSVTIFGAALGELQTALAALPIQSRPGRPLFERMFDFPAPAHNVMNLTPQSLHVADEPPMRDLLAWWQQEAHTLQAFSAGPYRLLPWQMCHNDFTPNNVLEEHGHVSAVLDFEFMSPAARALDVAMALRMTMRIWETPAPWDVVQAFFSGYRRWIHLTQAEIEALPLLLRLRGSMSILWWVGRQQGLARVPSLIENHQTMVLWLDQYEGRFLECVADES